jgi:hypothetical protein
MTASTLAAAVVNQTFPAGTTDGTFNYTVTGTLADGTTPFSQSQASGAFDLPAGVFTGVVSKTVAGSTISSLPSLPLTLSTGGGTTPVSLSVPDATQAAVLTSP